MTVVRTPSSRGPVMNAAEKALQTGNPRYVLIWIPAESENLLKNLLEKACCERTVKSGDRHKAADWYFRTVGRLHSRQCRPYNLDLSDKTPEEKKTILQLESAVDCGSFDAMGTGIPAGHYGEVRDRFSMLLEKKHYQTEDIAAGREYVSALTDFAALVNTLRTGSR